MTSTSNDGQLLKACSDSDLRKVTELVHAGVGKVNVNCFDAINGATPLWLACFNGNIGIVKALLAANVDVNLRNKHDGSTPLYVACIKRYYNVVTALLETGRADIELTTNGDSTNEDLIELEGDNPLFCAISNGDLRLVNLLFELASPQLNKCRLSDGHSPLSLAAQEGNVALVEFLLHYKADVNNAVPLFFACWQRHTDVIKLLLQNEELDVNLANISSGGTPLSIVCSGEDPEKDLQIIKLLLSIEKPANANKHTLCGTSPLCIACKSATLDIVQTLITQGKANINGVQQTDGASPLAVACSFGRIDVVELLLAHGAESISLFSGETPIGIAQTKGYVEIVALLQKVPLQRSLPPCIQQFTPTFISKSRMCPAIPSSLEILKLKCAIDTSQKMTAFDILELPKSFNSYCTTCKQEIEQNATVLGLEHASRIIEECTTFIKSSFKLRV